MPSLQPSDSNKPDRAADESAARYPSLVFVLGCFLGAVLSTEFGGIGRVSGVCLVTYCSTGLIGRGNAPIALLAILLAEIPGCILGSVTTASPGICLCLIAFVLTGIVRKGDRMRHEEIVWCMGTVAVSVVLVGADALKAWGLSTTLSRQLIATSIATVSNLTAQGALPAQSITALRSAVGTVANLWPALCFVRGLMYVGCIGVFSTIGWRRYDSAYSHQRFSCCDISLHFVWLLVVGLFSVAASYTAVPNARLVGLVGYNILTGAAAVYLVQGLALFAWWMEHAGYHLVIRVLLLIVALQLELMFLAVSLAGVIDLWANFRKLPRDQASSA